MIDVPRRVRKPAAAYHHGDLRAALLHSTRLLVQRGGLEALTLRAVARHAGVSPPALHHHFRDRTELLAAAAAESFDALDAALEEADLPHARATARIEALAVAYVRFAIERRGEFLLIFGRHVAELQLGSFAATRAPAERVKARLFATLEQALGRHVPQAVSIVWAQLVGLATLVVERELGPQVGVAEAEALARRAVRSHLAGLIRS